MTVVATTNGLSTHGIPPGTIHLITLGTIPGIMTHGIHIGLGELVGIMIHGTIVLTIIIHGGGEAIMADITLLFVIVTASIIHAPIQMADMVEFLLRQIVM
jgi:hypothetical protein